MKLRSISRTAGAAMLACALALGACQSGTAVPNMQAGDGGFVPVMPMPMPGQATLAGHVTDSAGNPIVGATVVIAETDGNAVTDAGGAYSMTVPSDSTLTVKATATNFAPAYRGSIMLAAQTALDTFDVTMLTPTEVAADNALITSVTTPATRGLVALRLHSVNAACSLAGAHLAVSPPDAATVVYAQPSTTGGMDQPDLTVDGVQDGASIGVWLVDAFPPASWVTISISQPGCALMASSPSMNGMMFTGAWRADAAAFTEADLFFDMAQ
jgi:hypothetical protein